MKNARRFFAALLALTMVLAMCSAAFAAPKFTKDDIGKMVKFTGSLHGYDEPKASARSKVIIKKGSTTWITGVKGNWVKLAITFKADEHYESVPDKELWFGMDKLEFFPKGYANVVFAAGGSGMSVEIYRDGPRSKLVGKTVKTTGKVKLRKTASLAGKCQGVVQKGKKLKLTGRVGIDSRGIAFFEVKYNKKKYFVSVEYIQDGMKLYLKS